MTSFFIAHKSYDPPSFQRVRGPVLVTGVAGFIGFHTAKALLDLGIPVVGVDNMNDYYDVTIKQHRLDILQLSSDFHFVHDDISNKVAMEHLFHHYSFKFVIHLAAQAGVRYSLSHPFSYLKSNIDGFLVLLECARHQKDFGHMVYASSSSVYGMNTKMPFREDDPVELPMSLYAATKRANELMAQSYYHLYHISLSGLRFFTVYGPWGRPDMAAFKFLNAMTCGDPIDVYNNGEMARDYTFVGDTVRGILGALDTPPHYTHQNPSHPLYNLGNNKLETLMDFISCLEKHAGIKAQKNMMPLQPGDVPKTAADTTKAHHVFGYDPTTSMDEGLGLFVDWHKSYYG